MTRVNSKLLTGGAVTALSVYCLYLIKKPRTPLISEERWNELFAALPNRHNNPEADDPKNTPHKVRLNKKRAEAIIEEKLDIIIIGSGLGGLTVGSLMSQRRSKVSKRSELNSVLSAPRRLAPRGYPFN